MQNKVKKLVAAGILMSSLQIASVTAVNMLSKVRSSGEDEEECKDSAEQGEIAAAIKYANNELLRVCSSPGDDVQKVRDLLGAGADSNTQNPDNGLSPLHYATRAKNCAIVSELAQSADINGRDQ